MKYLYKLTFRLTFIVCLICIGLTASAQYHDVPQDLPVDSIPEFRRIDSNRVRNKSFAQQTLTYAPLSYGSPPFSDWGSHKNGYILSADVIPQFVIASKWLPTPIHLTTRFKARILRDNASQGDSSLPVRTPSYMPGGTIFLPLHHINDQKKHIRYLSLSVFHHSNGQDGEEFSSPTKLNEYNGNFSTNFIEPAYHYRFRRDDHENQGEFRDHYFRAGFETHFKTAEKLRDSYGLYRLNLTWTALRVKGYQDLVLGREVDGLYYREHSRWVTNMTIIGGERELGLNKASKRINFDLNYNLRVKGSANTALFAGAGYFGSDTYNIYYQRSYFYIRVGLSLGYFYTPSII